MSAIFLGSNSVMNFVFLVILALSALRSGDADGCTSPYDKGPYPVQNLQLRVPIAQSVRFLWIAVPTVEGKFPVVQFQHGFDVRNTCYNRLILHVASYGFIVVAPQMDFTLYYNATYEISTAIHVIKWIQANIECALSLGGPEIKPDLSKLALVGHNRGGKVVFSMGIQLNGTSPISTIIGLDPVDGDRQGIQTDPPVLTFKENTLNLTVPTLIVGTRRGSENWPLFPPCAPENVSHNEFYKDLIEPVYHFVVAKESGHMDFLDDAVCELTRLECMGTVGSRARMSRFAGGVVAAFLQKIVGNNPCYFNYALTSYTSAPVILEVPEQKGELPHNHVSSIFTFRLVFGIPLDGLEGSILQEMVICKYHLRMNEKNENQCEKSAHHNEEEHCYCDLSYYVSVFRYSPIPCLFHAKEKGPKPAIVESKAPLVKYIWCALSCLN